MKVLAKIMEDVKVSKVEVKQDLGIEIEHDGKSFNIFQDNYGRLILSSNGTQLIIQPKASNTIEIKSEE
jgi:predicted RNA-binding protein